MLINKYNKFKVVLYRNQGFLIPLLYATILIPLFFLHDTFEEWDGVMHVFASREIISGLGYNGWTSHFWPPLYPLLIGVGSFITSGFVAAKLISMLSGTLLLYVAYEFSVELSSERKVGLLTQLFLVLNPLYVISSFQAANSMLDSLLFVSGSLFFLKSLKENKINMFFATGLLFGLAGLSRYTSYILIPASIIALFLLLDYRRASKFSLVLLAGFVVVSSPWLYYNTIKNGSPFHTWQYMNIGFGVAPNIDGKEWWWSAQSTFNGIMDIFVAMPFAYFKNFARNVVSSISILLMSSGVLAPFTVPAVFASVIVMKLKDLLFLGGLLILFIFLVSQAFVYQRVFLSWSVIMTNVSVMFLLKFADLCQKRFPFLEKCRFIVLVIVSLSVAGLALTSYQTVAYVNDKSDGGELADNVSLTKKLKEYDHNIESKVIMAGHPARAYYAGAKFMYIPRYFEGTLKDLVSYNGLSERVKEHAARYPSILKNSEIKADYLICDIFVKTSLPQFSFVFNPSSSEIPKNFKVVYRSSQVVAYEVIWPD